MIETLPLNALRAFVMAARSESFKQAAADLHVTAGAVSRQIRRLETQLGALVFERHAHGVRLNALGQTLWASADSALICLDEAFEQARAPGASTAGSQRLVVSAPPSFVQAWLLPRLAGFDAQDAEVELQASQVMEQPAWQSRAGTLAQPTLAIRYGRGPWPGVSSQALMSDVLYPVCAPSLLGARWQWDAPRDLAGQELLHVSWPSSQGVAFTGWRDWFDAFDAQDVDIAVRHRYSLFSMAIDQAVAGQGVVLASHAIVARYIQRGELVAPFGARFVMPAPLSYDLITPEHGQPPPVVARFSQWLLAQAQAFEQHMPRPVEPLSD